MVCSDAENGCILRRLADIKNGVIVPTTISYNKPFSPANITDIRQFTGIKQLGKVGVWRVICIPRTTKPDKYILKAYFQEDLHPVQVLKWADKSIDSARNMLFSEFPLSDTFDKTTPIAVLCNYTHGVYSELYCSAPILTRIGRGFTGTSKMKLSTGTKVDAIENIDSKEMISFSTIQGIPKLSFLRKIIGYNSSNNESYMQAQTIISDHIKHLATWKTFKAMGIEKHYVHLFWEFLTQLGSGTIYDDISQKCQCSHELAVEYVDEFIKNAGAYFESSDIDTEVLKHLVQQDSALREQFSTQVASHWEEENSELIKASETAIMEGKAQIHECSTKLSQLQAEETKLQNILHALHSEISAMEKKRTHQMELAEEATLKIQQKINTAREDVTEFIADISLYMPAVSNFDTHVTKTFTLDTSIRIPPSVSECEIADSLESLISWIDKNLIDAGVDGKKSEELAKYLYACNQAGISLILAGPGGDAIAKAFSCATSGRNPIQLVCDGDWNQNAINKLLGADSDIVIVKNPFNFKWIDRLPEVIFNSDKTFFLITPFKDDLIVEPADFYQYVLPLFTGELIIDGATNDYVCAKLDSAVSTEDWSQCEYDISEVITYPTGRMNRRLRCALGIFRKLQNTNFNHYAQSYCIHPLLTVLGKNPEQS